MQTKHLNIVLFEKVLPVLLRRTYLLLRCQITDVFPLFGEEKRKHAYHAECKADWETCHNVAAVDKAGDEIRGGNAHRPQHKDINDCGIPDFPYTVHKAYYTVKQGINAARRKYYPDIAHGNSENFRVFVEQTEYRRAADDHDNSGSPCDEPREKWDFAGALTEPDVIFGAEILPRECGGGGRKRGNCDVCDSVHLACNGTASHENRSLRVYQRLHQNVSY